MRLTAEGRARSSRWEAGEGMIPAHTVVIPGHWVPNEDGRRLYETWWSAIRVIDRQERYTFWHGIWARRHGDGS